MEVFGYKLGKPVRFNSKIIRWNTGCPGKATPIEIKETKRHTKKY